MTLPVLMACFKGCGAVGKGATDDRLAIFSQYLDIDAGAVAVLLEQPLRGNWPLSLIDLGPGLGEALQRRMTTENPGILIQRVAEQHGQAGHQCDGQPERCENAPEQ